MEEPVTEKKAGFGSAKYPQHGSDKESSGLAELDKSVDFVLRNAEKLTSIHLNDLLRICEIHMQERGERELTLSEELSQNKRIIRALRTQFFTANGSMKGDSVREIKDVLATMNSLETTIGKLEAQAINQDRIRALEKVVVSCIKELPEKHQEMFFLSMEDNFINLKEINDE